MAELGAASDPRTIRTRSCA